MSEQSAISNQHYHYTTISNQQSISYQLSLSYQLSFQVGLHCTAVVQYSYMLCIVYVFVKELYRIFVHVT